MRFGRKLSVPPPQPPTPSAEVLALRSNWKWAYLSHFLFTFNPVLHLENIQLFEFEDDLASGTYSVIPTIMQRLLMSLTPHDKRMILEDWQHQLRRQSLKRSPDDNLMGTEEDPINFESLIMTDKLELFYRMCEWQFHNPNSLRTRMRDDDECANWRIQPIAYDARGNAYWLLGGNRLWRQYIPLQRPRAKSNKRKRTASNIHEVAATSVVNSRKNVRRDRNVTEVSPVFHKTVKTRSKADIVSRCSSAPSSTRMRGPVRETRSQAAGLPPPRPRVIGTRASSRLRGKEEEWQEIPEEWLIESIAEASKVNGEKRRMDSEEEIGKGEDGGGEVSLKLIDDGSELTSLSDLSELPDEEEVKNETETDANDHKEEDESEEDDESDESDGKEVEEDKEDNLSSATHDRFMPDEEVWVCVTLQEWEDFPKQFQDATNSRERAFYKLLVNEIVPAIAEVLKVEVKKQVMEDAVMQRKRSSRLAMKESLREAERVESKRRMELGKEMERHRRWEARVKKEEEEKLKLESMRSARLKEKAGIFSNAVRNTSEGKVEAGPTNGTTQSKLAIATNGTVNQTITAHPKRGSSANGGTQTPKEDEVWELNCEICNRRGWNLDDGQELMSCEKCNKWQHIRCHDQSDFIAGRPRRNWELEEFVCNACQIRQRTSPQQLELAHLEQPPQIQSHLQLPKLQLHPSHQQQQPSYSPYPPSNHVSLQNWIMYNGSSGTEIKNGRPVYGNANAGLKPVKGKNTVHDGYLIAPQYPVLQSVYGHGHPYPYPPTTPATQHSSSPGSSYSTISTTGMSSHVQSHQSIAPSTVPSVPSASPATARSIPGYSYSPARNVSEYSGHYPVSLNSNSTLPRYAMVQRLPLAGSSQLSTPVQRGTTLNTPILPSQQYPEAWKSFQAAVNCDNPIGSSGQQSYLAAAMAVGGTLPNGGYASSSKSGTTHNSSGFRQGSPSSSHIAPPTGVILPTADSQSVMHISPQ